MLCYRRITTQYEHNDRFIFQNKPYYIHSIVRLTEEGQRFLDSVTRNVILTEQFTWWNGKMCWKYKFRRFIQGLTDAITDRSPDELIEYIVAEASAEYSSIETYGSKSPYYKTGTKYSKKDWEIPEVLKGWIIFILVWIASEICRETLLKSTIRGCYLYLFWPYRQMYINKHTVYIRDEDKPILREKYAILYLISKCGERNNNE